jgi:CBS domain-containing protein
MYAKSVHPFSPASPVRSVMVWPVATVEHDVTLTEVAEALAADEIGALCVVENDALAGIVSERDVVAHVATGADPAHLTAGDVMTSDVVTVGPEESLRAAARRMHDGQIRHLPVLEDGAIAGMISIRDLLAILVDHEGETDPSQDG